MSLDRELQMILATLLTAVEELADILAIAMAGPATPEVRARLEEVRTMIRSIAPEETS